MDFKSKIVPLDQLPAWREAFRKTGRKLVVTNGCFDILHLGHVTYLEAARKNGDALLIGCNGDAGVRELKGPSRPVNNETDRASILAALEAVTAVSIFPESRAIRFLSLAQPDIYVKGGDYTLETLNQEERRVVEATGGEFVFIPFVVGKSTTGLLEKITKL